MENLKNYDYIIIKQADKGSAVVILDRDKYVAEAMRQLNESEVYISLRDDPTVDMIRKVNGRVEKLHNDGYISQSTLQYLTNDGSIPNISKFENIINCYYSMLKYLEIPNFQFNSFTGGSKLLSVSLPVRILMQCPTTLHFGLPLRTPPLHILFCSQHPLQ